MELLQSNKINFKYHTYLQLLKVTAEQFWVFGFQFVGDFSDFSGEGLVQLFSFTLDFFSLEFKRFKKKYFNHFIYSQQNYRLIKNSIVFIATYLCVEIRKTWSQCVFEQGELSFTFSPEFIIIFNSGQIIWGIACSFDGCLD